MSSRLPPLNPLRAFEATARRGSVSAAARELNVTHGAISHQIRALELSFNAALFERGGKRLKLTSQGALLLPAVTHAFEGIAAATAAMTRPTTSGELRIVCVPALLSFWMIPRLHQFTEQFPDVQLTLIASNDAANLFSADVDICLLYGDGNWPDCWARLWSRLELFPVVSPTLLNMRPLRSLRDLRDHVILHGDDGREWNTWLAAADGIDIQRGRQHFMSDARLSTEAALHNQGVALGDTITAGSLICQGRADRPLRSHRSGQRCLLCSPAATKTARRRSSRSFIDWLFSALENDPMPELQTSARTIIRARTHKVSAPERLPAKDSFQPVSSPARSRRPEPTPKRRAKS